MSLSIIDEYSLYNNKYSFSNARISPIARCSLSLTILYLLHKSCCLNLPSLINSFENNNVSTYFRRLINLEILYCNQYPKSKIKVVPL